MLRFKQPYTTKDVETLREISRRYQAASHYMADGKPNSLFADLALEYQREADRLAAGG